MSQKHQVYKETKLDNNNRPKSNIMLLYSIRGIKLESSFNGRLKLCTLFLVLYLVFLSSVRNLNNRLRDGGCCRWHETTWCQL